MASETIFALALECRLIVTFLVRVVSGQSTSMLNCFVYPLR